MSMTNRYAPPASEVADVCADAQHTERPASVRIAVGLFVASGLLKVAKAAFFPPLVPTFVSAFASATPIGVSIAVSLLVFVLLAVALWHRRNWARILFIVILAIRLPAIFLITDQLRQQDALAIALLIIVVCLDVATAVYLFLGSSSNWYRKRDKQAFFPVRPSADVQPLHRADILQQAAPTSGRRSPQR
jgi:hypothetical protein